MNKRGLTLIELLAVITLIGVVIGISVPSIKMVSKTIKNNMLNTKINLIEESANLYGEDNIEVLKESTTKYNTYPCLNIIVSNLVPSYLENDNDNICLSKDSSNTSGCITDPSNKNNYLDKLNIIIYFKDNKVHSILDIDNKNICS